jgi:PucR-like helix-turn-helix protein
VPKLVKDRQVPEEAARRPWESLPPEALDALARELEPLTDEIVDAIAAEIPAYERALEGAFGQTVRGGVEQALQQFDEMARNPGTGRSAGREVYVGLGRLEFRAGRTLEALLSAYRLGARVAWRRLAGAGLEAGLSPQTLVLLAESIFAYIDELSAESAEGFAEEQADRAGESDRRRGALIGLLLQTPPPEPALVSETAAAADWRLPRELAVILWDAESGRGRRAAARLPLGSIAATVEGLRCAIVPDPGGPGRAAEIRAALEDVRAGIGPAVPWQQAARSHRQAAAALGLAEDRESPGALAADEHRAELLLRAEPHLVADLAGARLAPLADETPASRKRLKNTLLSWLRHDGNVTAAAEELDVHPQTVRYRLGRLRELLGDALDDPDGRFELELALRAESLALG